MRHAIFGGSFNPPHVAHVMACAYILSRGAADRVLVVPCGRHAFDKGLAPFEHRLAMCRLAVKGVLDGVEISDIEGRREGVTYTIDTVEALRRERPGDEFILAVGSDILEETDQWKDFERLRELAPPWVIPRLGSDTLEEAVESRRFALPAVSSTSIRERLDRGEVPDELLPKKVADYIRRNGLYGIQSAKE